MMKALITTAAAIIIPTAAYFYPIVRWLLLTLVILFVGYIATTTTINRQPVSKEGQELIEKCIQDEMLIRKRKYDVYVPKGRGGGSKKMKALLFLPGALVDHGAYVGIASRIAKEGILVAIYSAEPLRMPAQHLGLSSNVLVNIARDIEQTFGVSYEWNIGGHSMGSYAAAVLFHELQKQHDWKKLIIGTGLPGKIFSEPAIETSVLTIESTLVIQGTEDGFYQYFGDTMTVEEVRKRVQLTVIEGGNHAGFGHYGPQTFPIRDGERTIPLNKQHDLTANAIIKFLK